MLQLVASGRTGGSTKSFEDEHVQEEEDEDDRLGGGDLKMSATVLQAR